MPSQKVELAEISGTFFRIVFEHQTDDALDGAASPQGRYHHDGQRALYLSPEPEWAWKAVDSYIQPGDPARRVRQLRISKARVVDIRNEEACRRIGIGPSDSAVPWQPQLTSGVRPATWNVTDRARQAGAEGLIYAARTAPDRWHLVLFVWNDRGGPTVEYET